MLYILLAFAFGILTIEFIIPLIEALTECILALKEWFVTFVATKVYKLKASCEEDDEIQEQTNAIGFMYTPPEEEEEDDLNE